MSNEEEQLESLKRFMKDYGSPIVIGVALAVAVIAGWKFWQNQRMDASSHAISVYQSLIIAEQRSQLNPADKAASAEVLRLGKALKDDFSSTIYAQNAGLILAQEAAGRADWQEAEKQLRWVLEQKPGEAERVLTVTRLARVLATQKQYDAALALLNKENNSGFAPTVAEIKGDIYLAQGKLPDAQKAYTAAAEALRDRDERNPQLDMKMADVGLAPLPDKKADDKKAGSQTANTESNPS